MAHPIFYLTIKQCLHPSKNKNIITLSTFNLYHSSHNAWSRFYYTSLVKILFRFHRDPIFSLACLLTSSALYYSIAMKYFKEILCNHMEILRHDQIDSEIKFSILKTFRGRNLLRGKRSISFPTTLASLSASYMHLPNSFSKYKHEQ